MYPNGRGRCRSPATPGAASRVPGSHTIARGEPVEESGETSSFSIADQFGNLVSVGGVSPAKPDYVIGR